LIRALESYQSAAALAPEDANYWRMLAVFSAQNNANVKDVGIPAAQKAVALSEKDPSALDALGWLLLLDGRYYESERILKQVLDQAPEIASAHFHLALLYLQTGDRASLYDHLVKARDLGSEEAGLLLRQEFP
jgi:Flp pilus assembly protein TadD